MNNIPSVLAILLCDWIIVEQGTEKKTLVGLFNNLNASAFPTGQRVGFYARLTDLEGDYRFQIRIVRLVEESEEVMGGAEAPFRADDRLAILEMAVNLPFVPLVAPGSYEFQLFSDDVYLGRATLNVQQSS
jgi:uncharacterized protein DUF6941